MQKRLESGRGILKKMFFILVLVSLAGCTTITVKDNTVKLDTCEDVTFQLIIHQDPSSNRVIEETVDDGEIEFESMDLDVFDFTRPITLSLIAKHVPAHSECVISQSAIYEAINIILRPVPNEDKAYEIDLSEFQRR